MENEKRILSASEWLKKHRNEGCPLHGFHISRSLVTYSGYCRYCNRFWRYICYNEMAAMPYNWFYFDPETRKRDGDEYFRGYHAKPKHKGNQGARSKHKGVRTTQ